MLIAQQKRKENIAEYLIYMFQVEDMIRVCKLDIHIVDEHIISQYNESYEVKRDIREWYNALISMMKEKNIEKSGHIPILESLISDLNEIHESLLNNPEKNEYLKLYHEAKPAVDELKIKSGDPETNDIKASFTGLYGYLLLKISSKDINPETESAINQISNLLASLSLEFHKLERGESSL